MLETMISLPPHQGFAGLGVDGTGDTGRRRYGAVFRASWAMNESTAADAAKTALDAGAHRLALSHFSQRYTGTDQHIKEAQAVFANVIALNDLDRVTIPRRA